MKLLLRTRSSDTHQWPEGTTLVFCLLTLFWNHPDADASNQGRSWSSPLGAWDLTLGQGFGNKLSHLLDFLTGFCRLVLEKNISVSTSMALWFSCYGNISIFKMPSTRFAQCCICICMLGYLELEVRKGEVWNTLMNIKVTTSIANQSITNLGLFSGIEVLSALLVPGFWKFLQMMPTLYNSVQKNFCEDIVTVSKTGGLQARGLSMVGREQSWKHWINGVSS